MGGDPGSPWVNQRTIIEGLVPTAREFDQDGVDLIAIMEQNPMAVTRKVVYDAGDGLKFVDSFRSNLRGSTPTRGVYKTDMEAHVAKCITDPMSTKRLNGIIITDGEPTDKDVPSMTATTEWATLELKKNGLEPKRYLGMSYVIVTTKLSVMAGYRILDQRNMWGSGDNKVECDFSNAIYPYLIKAFGGPGDQAVTNLILAANSSEACDTAAENLVEGTSKDIMNLTDAYIREGYATEV